MAKYGDASNAYRVRVLGEFPTSDDETVIPLELVLGAVGRNVSTLDYHPVWGVDIARFGDDGTALAKRQANKLLEPVKRWNSMDLKATAGKIKAEYDATPYNMPVPPEILHRCDKVSVRGSMIDPRNWACQCVASTSGKATAHETTVCASAMSCGSRDASGSRIALVPYRKTTP